MEQVGQHGRGRAGPDKALDLERLHVRRAEMFGFGIEQPAIGAADAVRSKGLFQVVALQQDRKAGDRAFLGGCGRQRCQRRPDVFLHVRRDRHAFAHEDRHDPVRRPGAFIGVVDAGKRLQRNRCLCPFREAAAQVVPVAAHGEGGGADAAAEIECEHLVSGVAPELQGHEGEQHGFARARGADDKRMAYVADMET